ncbi:hypothetical protein P1J78_11715 [Psychromarinibacter sp. C21-152]|uniref:Uncharacterized protein n=1 Tax=Psychromarinibacter sediminicola TaxID=3033385 RepID=A0AAE3NS26_9RHOB|nr:hypothetical protein [Psychromarinibacter sediminicola]MDF0601401.1 hypothetical protein [Psychromarinibacter sediminicola]
MIWLAETLEATGLAQFLKRSRWVYPFVNAGHILGIALLVGAVLPMDVQVLRRRNAAVALLRRWAAAGLALAAACGALLFVTQAGDYAVNGWFQAKMALLAVALANAALHLRRIPPWSAALSLMLWPAILICGRLIAYS